MGKKGGIGTKNAADRQKQIKTRQKDLEKEHEDQRKSMIQKQNEAKDKAIKANQIAIKQLTDSFATEFEDLKRTRKAVEDEWHHIDEERHGIYSKGKAPPSSYQAYMTSSTPAVTLAAAASGQLAGSDFAGGQYEEDDDHIGKGYVRDQVDDTKWEQKLEVTISQMQEAYDKLPSPITPMLLAHIIISFIIVVGSAIAIVVILVVSVIGFSNMAAEVLLSGMRPPTLAQILYLTLHLFI
ncbi:MAG: hypothetical protein EZS28_027337, partial [Streblomastix strix]